MPCILAIIGLLVPRVLIILLWLFSTWFVGVFDNILWPVLGFIFLPTTLLWYSVVVNWFGGAWTMVPLIGIIIAALIDLSPASSRRGY